ncbi:sigma-70 family RNA polymerase sigma factor [Salirhabdus salicampi]|uniref:sigma-70 family RNA polymerase sigma factor n=1 Tax=Salirhabdus salicampi TaxID=476102 RepID=UPI0020C4C72F|nr:sigma-70 family RNA polymerase sigma factor [Salirhabdus salicampi]
MDRVKEKPFHEVLKENEKMIYHVIKRYGIRDLEGEFYQEGAIALWKAYEQFDPSKGKFSSFAYFRIQKALIDYIRKQRRYVKVEDTYKESMKADLNHVTTTMVDFFDPYLLAQIEELLTENQRTWFRLYVLEDLSVKEIAQKEQVTENAVKNWGRLARQKIRKLLEQKEYVEGKKG